MLPFAAASSTLIQVALGLVGALGAAGGVAALLKLRPDVNTAAVTQAQGAAETMAVLQRELIADRDHWRTEALSLEREVDRLQRELAECERRHPKPTTKRRQ